MTTAIERVARDLFGWDSLRAGQLEAIRRTVDGTDTLGVMPTGYGKSAIYQVAGALSVGVTVVVSPLIALESDQISTLAAHPRAPLAVAVNSGQGIRANTAAWSQIVDGTAKYLLLSPEQLARADVVERLARVGVGLFVVDEAHSVAAWGHDFRPDYLRLTDAIETLGHPTVLALTATGSPPVRDEIVRRLGMRDPAVLTYGFDRPNLRLEVVRHEDAHEKHAAVLGQVLASAKPGLVYVATHHDTESFAAELSARGIHGVGYHAGLSAAVRASAQAEFHSGVAEVVVATSAFGMGIDKPNVRFVVHSSIPDSLDSYYQEVGRAGRDGAPATVTLNYRAEDLGLLSFFAGGVPRAEDLGRVFETVSGAAGPARVADLATTLAASEQTAARLVNLLEEAGVVTHDHTGVTADATVSVDDATRRGVEAGARRERIERSRIAMMRAYAETRRCRRQVLLGYFGEELAQPCGNCDTCSSGSAYSPAFAVQTEPAFPEGATVVHIVWGTGVVMSEEGDSLTVFFDREGYKVLSVSVIEERQLLTLA